MDESSTPPDLKLVQQWLEKTQEDVKVAQLVPTAAGLTAAICFHCQQAAEKSLKGYPEFRRVEFEWSHDLSYLLDLRFPLDTAFEQFRDQAEHLNRYAVLMRYPSSRPDPTAEQTRGALATAREVYDFVRQRLPPETHPAEDI